VETFAQAVHQDGGVISAYVFSDYVTAIESCYQDWPDFSRYLDFLVETTYEVQGEYARTLMERARRVTAGTCPVGAAVYSLPHVRRSEKGGRRWWQGRDQDVLDTVVGCREGGAETVWLFTADALLAPDLAPDRRDFLLGGIRRAMEGAGHS
jgi:hypothetical protein